MFYKTNEVRCFVASLFKVLAWVAFGAEDFVVDVFVVVGAGGSDGGRGLTSGRVFLDWVNRWNGTANRGDR